MTFNRNKSTGEIKVINKLSMIIIEFRVISVVHLTVSMIFELSVDSKLFVVWGY